MIMTTWVTDDDDDDDDDGDGGRALRDGNNIRDGGIIETFY